MSERSEALGIDREVVRPKAASLINRKNHRRASDPILASEAKRLLDYLNDVPFAWVGNGTLAKLRRLSEVAE